MAFETYSVVISGNLSGQFVQNVLHVGGDNVGGRSAFAQADDIARTLADTIDIWSTWLAILPVGYRALSLRVRKALPAGGPTIILPGPGGSPGLGHRTGEISTFTQGPIVDLYNVSFGGRVGKIFVPGISETDIAAGVYTGSFINAYESNWQNFFNAPFTLDLSGDSYTWGIISRVGTPTFLPTSDVRLSLTVGTQRKRERPTA